MVILGATVVGRTQAQSTPAIPKPTVADTLRRASWTPAADTLPVPEATAARASAIVRVPIRSGDSPSRRADDPSTGSRFEQPRWVMFRSLVVPGWGQFHNRAWLKAALFAGTEIVLSTRLLGDDRALGRLQADVDAAQAVDDRDGFNLAVAAYNARLDESINRRWLLGGLLVYALLDAYVDAHFVHFEAEFEHDPALPEGVKPPSRMRVSVEWPF